MVAETKYFGTVDIEEDKILEFPNGIVGFENLKKFAIMFDIDKGEDRSISWLQSLDEPMLALPVVNPFNIMSEYNPLIEDELLKIIDSPTEEQVLVMLALNVPSDITKMTANMKAPFIINSQTRKGSQIIVENQDYEIKYNVYDAIQKMKEKAGE